MKQLCIYFTLLFFSAFSANISAQSSGPGEEPGIYGSGETGRFAAMIMKMKNSDAGPAIAVVETKLISGICKEQPFNMSDVKENDLVFFIMNESNETIDTLMINDPLTERREFSEDGRTLQTITVNHDENTFLLRFNLHGPVRSVLVSRSDKDHVLSPVVRIPVNFN